MTTRLDVSLGDRSYPILIGEGILDRLGEHLSEVLPAPRPGRVAVITDSRVAGLYLDRARQALTAAGYSPIEVQIPEGEQHKNLAWLALTYDRLIEAQIERSTPVVALGGGVVGDLAGFAAATILRGVPFIQVPTLAST